MQGIEAAQRGYLDVESLAGELLAPGSAYAFLAEHRSELFPDSMMEDLFPSKRGRPSIPASVIGTVLVLQALEGLSDRAAAEALTYDLRWKAACGYGLTETAFHPTALVHWRNRLRASDSPHRINEAVAQVITATGVLAGRHRRAVDSTVFQDAVARQDTITQLIAVIRRFGRVMEHGATLMAVHATSYDYTRTGKPEIAWDDKEAKDELISGLVTDALALLGAVDPYTLEEGSPAAQAYVLLALVSGQDVEPAEGSDGTDGRWRIARKVAPDRIVSTVDPEARHAHKSRSVMMDGYKGHIVAEPETGLYTSAVMTKAAGPGSSDADAGIVLLGTDPTMKDDGTHYQVLGDSAYGSGAMLEALDGAGHQGLVKPKPLRPAVPGGYDLDDFTHDEGKNTLTCPRGEVRTISAKGNVNFGAACKECPLRDQCTTAKGGRKVVITKHHARQRAHRAAARAEAFRHDYRAYRPLVERSIGWLVAGGNRRLRYRGVEKNNAWLQVRTAALNLRRLLKLGLIGRDGAWAIG
ncbi:IS1182 family transposase [Arthrobacter wenxiniae]|uniref:IS1182 family transposase n=1 Tax=Arthrobacter wenxiniae TaxID=2713570 RepID=A0A7Y7M1F9_9MICC|nr:IS1182 family transposase [Arthrobacter wenxiniae]NVM97029.1 IS1182 family transposase [Arthrobacter wenxiniae]